MIPKMLPTRFFVNPENDPAHPYGPEQSAILNAEAHEEAFREISSWEGYAPTPLRNLRGLSPRLGVESLWYKDESTRFGLGSFKALGGIYGVLRAVGGPAVHPSVRGSAAHPSVRGPAVDPTVRGVVARTTVTCASAGNHGRAVARGAAMFGCRAVIFLPTRTPLGRVQAIRELGARVVHVDGTYDQAVEQAAREAKEHGWTVVSDTAHHGDEEVPRHIMQGYTVMAREALAQLPADTLPTHLFLQAGVGGMAAAVTAHFWEALGRDRPRVVVVEPDQADCLLESARARGLAPSRGSLSTSMDCLACRNPSALAWKILNDGADAFLSVSDRAAEEAVALLKHGAGGDPPIHTQPSGAAGLAGLMAAIREPRVTEPLGLDNNSRILVIGSEGPPMKEESP